jgi:tRNA dimethylallyltransferase
MTPLLIMGPTGSGKSELALALAERLNAVIINADASQVYRDLSVLSARPGAADEARAPHRLYGFVDAGERYSAGKWIEAALAEIKAARAQKKRAILVGGTGLYFKALTEGLAETPPVPDEVRAALGAALKAEGIEALHARLPAEDAARIRPSDTARVLRALEVLEVTGGSIFEWRQATQPALTAWVGLALTPDREALYARLDARFEAMLAAGALEEAHALMARGLDRDLPAMKALGAPWLMAHLRGEMSRERAVDLAKRDTRRYAKRQFTWIAGQMRAWPKSTDFALTPRLETIFALLGGVDGALSVN